MYMAGSYWSERKEDREQAARRILSFLEVLSATASAVGSWYFKGSSKTDALSRPLQLDLSRIAEALEINRRDTDQSPISELGFSMSLWNGAHVSANFLVGCYTARVLNAVVLTESKPTLTENEWRHVLDALIKCFEPDHAAICKRERLYAAEAARPWDLGWLTYAREGQVVEHSDRR